MKGFEGLHNCISLDEDLRGRQLCLSCLCSSVSRSPRSSHIAPCHRDNKFPVINASDFRGHQACLSCLCSSCFSLFSSQLPYCPLSSWQQIPHNQCAHPDLGKQNQGSHCTRWSSKFYMRNAEVVNILIEKYTEEIPDKKFTGCATPNEYCTSSCPFTSISKHSHHIFPRQIMYDMQFRYISISKHSCLKMTTNETFSCFF